MCRRRSETGVLKGPKHLLLSAARRCPLEQRFELLQRLLCQGLIEFTFLSKWDAYCYGLCVLPLMTRCFGKNGCFIKVFIPATSKAGCFQHLSHSQTHQFAFIICLFFFLLGLSNASKSWRIRASSVLSNSCASSPMLPKVSKLLRLQG